MSTVQQRRPDLDEPVADATGQARGRSPPRLPLPLRGCRWRHAGAEETSTASRPVRGCRDGCRRCSRGTGPTPSWRAASVATGPVFTIRALPWGRAVHINDAELIKQIFTGDPASSARG